MSDRSEELAGALSSIADALADLALDQLRQASDTLSVEGMLDPGLVAEEKRVTRARRAVERAAALLRTAEHEDWVD